MNEPMQYSERRQHKRYLAEGNAVVNTVWGQVAAQLIDLGRGGVLLLATEGPAKAGEQIDVRFAIAGYPFEIRAKGQVVRTDSNAIGIAFADPPAELEKALLWLEAGSLSGLV
jgi:PilZ domain